MTVPETEADLIARQFSRAQTADQPLHVPLSQNLAWSQMRGFQDSLESEIGRKFSNHIEFSRYTSDKYEFFWSHLLEWLALPVTGSSCPSVTGHNCETSRFFPNLSLNFAECLLIGADNDLALIGVGEGNQVTRLTRGELRVRVLRLAAGLKSLGLAPGDSVVAILRNDVEAVVAVLAVAACGGVIATAAPEMGADLLAERLEPFSPKMMITARRARPRDAAPPLRDRAKQLAKRLPSLETVLILDGEMSDLAEINWGNARVFHVEALSSSPGLASFDHFPFNQPLFVLFSSGTTGPAKGFVHGAGGTLLEHLKEHRLHGDLRPGDRLFFQTSPAWMMWHWQLSALGAGAAILLFDGVVSGPETLWQIAGDHQVTVLGTSPPYLQLCQSLDYEPARHHDLAELRSVLSTGSILHPDQARWVCDRAKSLPVQSISGGSDIIGCFVLGHPDLPTYAGEAQCVSLGLDVQSCHGELVCRNPFPSRPIGLLADPDGSRLHSAYFSGPDDAWRHGDRIEITPRGGVILQGRIDGVLNIRGIRIGPAEIYRCLRSVPEIVQALAVEQAVADAREERMVLIVTLSPGATLTPELKRRIRRTLSEQASPNHAPQVILAVADLPMTHSGKPSEAAARDLVNGLPVRNQTSLKNPEILAGLRQALLELTRPTSAPTEEDATEQWLSALWADLLQAPDLEPDDNFFELGGHSLMAARILAEVCRRTGRALPMATLLHAPTVRSLAAAIAAPDWRAETRLVPLAPGRGDDPFFIVHSMTGNVLQLHSLVRALGETRSLIGIQARGLDLDAAPLNTVEAMAADYLDAVRLHQPKGPYHLGGFSFGGLVAFEMARQLRASGEEVALLVLLDTQPDKAFLPILEKFRLLGTRLTHHGHQLLKMGPSGQLAYLRDRIAALAGRRPPPPAPAYAIPPHIQLVREGILEATRRYRPRRYDGNLLFIRAAIPAPVSFDPVTLWQVVTKGRVETLSAPGDHDSMIEPPYVDTLASILRERL